MREKYQEYKGKYEKELFRKNKASGLLGFIKLFLVVLLAFAVWLFFRNAYSAPYMVAMILLVILNVVFWVKHGVVLRQVRYIKGMIEVVDRYIARIDGAWTAFPDSGDEYMDYNHPYTYDLDIFGPKSLFQFLNVTGTYFGRKRFKEDLACPDYAADEIVKRQGAIRELSSMDAFSHNFQHQSGTIENQDSIPSLVEKIKGRGDFLKSGGLKYALRYMPFVFIPVILIIFIAQYRPLYITAFVLIGLLMFAWVALAYKTFNYLSFIQKAKYGLEKYSTLYGLLEKQEFKSPLLKEIQVDITSGGYSAATATRQLEKIVQRVEMRNNFILYIVLNLLFLWDVQCSLSLEKWKNTYTPYFDQWFESLGKLESLLSFSVLENVVDGTACPAVLPVAGRLEAEKIGHPLIPNDKRVCNNFTMCNDITIVSGSNMSGKTTFLRTVGINLVLAKCGCPVCARSMRFSPGMRIVTSMRISDDLNEGVSTFYAELKKIKAIIDMARQQGDVLFFIDEIFKGTNSADRTAGAKAVIAKLYGLKACGFLTTHDLALCEYSDGTHVTNRHFSERYVNGSLTFDYQIKPGIAKTTNGRYLMQMIGILDS